MTKTRLHGLSILSTVQPTSCTASRIFAISIAVLKGDKLIAGIIFDPCRNEFFHAEQGTGAFVNGRRMRVSGRRQMADALFATGIPFLGRGSEETDAQFQGN